MFTEVFFYDEYREEYTSMDFLIASVNPTEICYIFEGNFAEKRVTFIRTTDGIMWERCNVGWRKHNV